SRTVRSSDSISLKVGIITTVREACNAPPSIVSGGRADDGTSFHSNPEKLRTVSRGIMGQ
ncbi:hypothetical protein, partial [Agrococcus casei]|uniref:hypothetical protein n=1 Tax=Agrococcus casei TaxID=343512 RepID=UPI003F9BAC8A